jgi:hypothetical protein
VLGNQRQVLSWRKGIQSLDGNPIAGLDLVVVGGVDKSEREHALLLQVGFMDTGKGPSDDGKTSEETGLESGVFTRGAFAVVMVTDDNPFDSSFTVLSGDLGNASPLSSVLVLDLVGLAVFGIDGAN